MTTSASFALANPTISRELQTQGDASLPGRDIQLDYVNKRWLLTNRDFTLTRGEAAIKQRIDLRINLFLGEYFPDVTEGTPWYEQIFVKPASVTVVKSILRERILGVPGVIAVNNVVFRLSANREAYFEYDVLTDVGQIVSSSKVSA